MRFSGEVHEPSVHGIPPPKSQATKYTPGLIIRVTLEAKQVGMGVREKGRRDINNKEENRYIKKDISIARRELSRHNGLIRITVFDLASIFTHYYSSEDMRFPISFHTLVALVLAVTSYGAPTATTIRSDTIVKRADDDWLSPVYTPIFRQFLCHQILHLRI